MDSLPAGLLDRFIAGRTGAKLDVLTVSFLASVRDTLLDVEAAVPGLQDVRLVVLSSDALVAWVVGPGRDGGLKAVGWGRQTGFAHCHAGNVGVIRGYNRPSSQPPCAGDAPPVLRTSPPEPGSVVLRPDDQPVALGPGDLLLLSVRRNAQRFGLLLGFRPDAHLQLANQPQQSQQAPQHQRTPARQQQGSAPATPAAPGLTLSTDDLRELTRLAAVAVAWCCAGAGAGLLGKAADALAPLSLAPGLHDLLGGALEAVEELLLASLSVRLTPVLALAAAPAAGSTSTGAAAAAATGTAALVVRRDGPGAAAQLNLADSLLDTHVSVLSIAALAAASAVAPSSLTAGVAIGPGSGPVPATAVRRNSSLGADKGGKGLGRALSELSVTHGGSGALEAAGGGVRAGVRAVRLPLTHTLLAEAMRIQPSPPQNPVARGSLPAHATWALQSGNFAKTSMGLIEDPMATTQSLTHPVPRNVSQPHLQLPPPPPNHQRFASLVIRHAAGHVLEEQQPCRDILTLAKLMAASGGGGGGGSSHPHGGAPGMGGGGRGVGSLVLVVELEAAVPGGSSSVGGSGVNASLAAPLAGLCLGGALGGTSSAPQGQSRALASGPQGQGPGQGGPLFALYLVSRDTLPSSLLASINEEAQLIMGLVLDSCRAAIASGGRVAAELASLLVQLGGGAGPSVSGSGTVPAGAATVPPTGPHGVGQRALAGAHGGLSSSPSQAVSGSMLATAGAEVHQSGSKQGAGLLGLRTMSAVRRVSSAHPLVSRSSSRPHMAVAAALLGAGGPGSPSVASRFGASGPEGASIAMGVPREAWSRMLTPPNELSGADELPSAQATNAAEAWLVATGPLDPIPLEAASGPSPLELMVSSMRAHLSAVATEAAAAEDATTCLLQDMAALDLREVIGRGGQGVVFKGYLHGLETAVKVTVYRDGEPLAEDQAEGPAAAAGAGASRAAAPPKRGGSGSREGADGAERTAAEDEAARVRRAKRGALEHAVMPTLSHPYVLQCYAAFSGVVIAKQTIRGESRPRLRLCMRDDPLLGGIPSPGPLNQVICFEYCDEGTLSTAASAGAFRLPGSTPFAAIVRPALVPLFTSLLEVALALRYLHSRRLVHCDLKPGNVLLKSSNRDGRGWTCKLSDFGCCRLLTEHGPLRLAEAGGSEGGAAGKALPPGPPGANAAGGGRGKAPSSVGFKMAAPLGTLAYMAPECFVKGALLTPAVDVYAFGIMMYELLMCIPPYNGVPQKDLARHVLHRHARPEFHPLAPLDYCALASRCWATHPERRPTASELVADLSNLLDMAKRDEVRRQEKAALCRTGVTTSGSSAAASASSLLAAGGTAAVGGVAAATPSATSEPPQAISGLRSALDRVLMRPPGGTVKPLAAVGPPPPSGGDSSTLGQRHSQARPSFGRHALVGSPDSIVTAQDDDTGLAAPVGPRGPEVGPVAGGDAPVASPSSH